MRSGHRCIFSIAEQQYGRSIVARVRYRHTCMRVRKMLVASFILVISVAALVQFAVFTWRAGLLQVVAEDCCNSLESKGFEDIAAYQRLCPEVQSGTSTSLGSVRLYHSFLQFLSNLTGSGNQGWAQREMALCTRYASVVLSQHMQRNQALAAEARSF